MKDYKVKFSYNYSCFNVNVLLKRFNYIHLLIYPLIEFEEITLKSYFKASWKNFAASSLCLKVVSITFTISVLQVHIVTTCNQC